MIDAMRTCPACRTYVLPNPDDTCPACRKHKFDAAVPEASVRAAVAAASKAEQEESMWRGARAFWILQWAVVATLLLSIANLVIFEGGTARRGFGMAIAQFLLAISILACAMAGLVAAYRVAKWLRWGVPMVWAILAAVPYVGVVVLIVMSRAALTEFKHRQVPIRLFGPRIPRRPEPA